MVHSPAELYNKAKQGRSTEASEEWLPSGKPTVCELENHHF